LEEPNVPGGKKWLSPPATALSKKEFRKKKRCRGVKGEGEGVPFSFRKKRTKWHKNQTKRRKPLASRQEKKRREKF